MKEFYVQQIYAVYKKVNVLWIFGEIVLDYLHNIEYTLEVNYGSISMMMDFTFEVRVRDYLHNNVFILIP